MARCGHRADGALLLAVTHNTPAICGDKSGVRLRSHYAESISKRIAAKGDGWARAAFEFLLAFRASTQRLGQETFKIFDVEVNMNWSPVALISANVVQPLRWFGTCRLLNQSDLGVATFENNVRCDRSSDLGKLQSAAIESKTFVKSWNVN
jgi:hypothetical protein